MVSEAFNSWIVKGLIAVALIIVGLFAGKIFESLLMKLERKFEAGKKVRASFVRLFIKVLSWCIYLVFINLALFYLNIPLVEQYVIKFLMIIPAFIGALILLAIGFAIAIYLRGVIEDSEVTGWKFMSKFLFYFIVYIVGVYAIMLALIAIDAQTAHWIILILTAVAASATAYVIAKKELKTNGA